MAETGFMPENGAKRRAPSSVSRLHLESNFGSEDLGRVTCAASELEKYCAATLPPGAGVRTMPLEVLDSGTYFELSIGLPWNESEKKAACPLSFLEWNRCARDRLGIISRELGVKNNESTLLYVISS